MHYLIFLNKINIEPITASHENIFTVHLSITVVWAVIFIYFPQFDDNCGRPGAFIHTVFDELVQLCCVQLVGSCHTYSSGRTQTIAMKDCSGIPTCSPYRTSCSDTDPRHEGLLWHTNVFSIPHLVFQHRPSPWRTALAYQRVLYTAPRVPTQTLAMKDCSGIPTCSDTDTPLK